jgi:hypothetical protein
VRDSRLGAPPGPVPLSNRRGTCPESGHLAGRGHSIVGVDRVSLSFPVSVFDRDDRSWSSVTLRNAGSEQQVRTWGATGKVNGATVFVGVSEMELLSNPRGKVEFNPSRLVDPEGWGLARPSEVREVLAEVVPLLRDRMTFEGDLEAWKVRRVDVARDFEGVSEASNKVRSLAPLPRPWARRNLVHSDPSKHGAQTLMVGSGAGVVRLYDKHAETSGRAPDGVLRWEAECRHVWADKYGGLRALADITEEKVMKLAEDRWAWSGIGTEVGSMSRVYDLVRSSDLSQREQNGFLVYLWGQSAGDLALSSRTSLAKYRRIQRELGLVIEPGTLDGAAGGIVSRLDWESGTEIFRVA